MKTTTNLDLTTDDRIASINYAGQLRLRRRQVHQKTVNSKFLLDIQGYFNCESSDHLARDCLYSLNLARAAIKKLEYLNKKKESNAVHVVLASMYQQPDSNEQTNNDASIVILIINGNEDETEPDASEEAVILESTLKINSPDDESFRGACIDFEAQLTVIG